MLINSNMSAVVKEASPHPYKYKKLYGSSIAFYSF